MSLSIVYCRIEMVPKGEIIGNCNYCLGIEKRSTARRKKDKSEQLFHYRLLLRRCLIIIPRDSRFCCLFHQQCDCVFAVQDEGFVNIERKIHLRKL